jgi:AP-3 complex subunit delta
MEDSDISWANFDILQLMSSSSFPAKNIAFTTANLAFNSNTDCLIMTVNLFKKVINHFILPIFSKIFELIHLIFKELINSQYIETSVMLGCLANICNPQIATETIELTMSLLSHNKPLIRKKSAAVIGKMFLIVPDLIPNNFEKVIGKIANEENPSKNSIVFV